MRGTFDDEIRGVLRNSGKAQSRQASKKSPGQEDANDLNEEMQGKPDADMDEGMPRNPSTQKGSGFGKKGRPAKKGNR